MRQGSVALAVTLAAALATTAACGSLRTASDDAPGDGATADGGSSGTSPAVEPAGDASAPGDDAGSAASVDLERAMWPLPPASPATGDYAVTTGTVLDEHTRLVWERDAPSAEATLDAARARCGALVLEGQDDWRLPTRIELLSLVDYGRPAPALNAFAFAAVSSGGTYWTASADATDPGGKAWTIAFGAGASAPEAITATHRARCVRGTPPARADYTLEPDVAVDVRTGLTWQRRLVSAGQSWVQAIATCQAATTAGKNGWRLPTARELESIVDVRRATAPAWTSAFDGDTALLAWSITGVPGDTTRAFVVDFGVAHATTVLERTAQASVRCVTGP